jgi:hypothetical protein
MTAFSSIDRIARLIRERLGSASVLSIVDEYGETIYPRILDRDEDPAILADSPEGLPAICVIPIGDKSDNISPYIGSADWEHRFQVVIVGYYRATRNEIRGEDIYDDIDTLRKKAYDCAELFKGNGAFFQPGCIYDVRVELGYFEVVDYVIYKFLVTLNITTIEL